MLIHEKLRQLKAGNPTMHAEARKGSRLVAGIVGLARRLEAK